MSSISPKYSLGASRKHLEAISSLPAEKHVIDWEAYSKVIKGHSDVLHDLKVDNGVTMTKDSKLHPKCFFIISCK